MTWPRMDNRSANLDCRSVQVCNKLCRSISSVGRVPASRAGYHKQTKSEKMMFTATLWPTGIYQSAAIGQIVR